MIVAAMATTAQPSVAQRDHAATFAPRNTATAPTRPAATASAPRLYSSPSTGTSTKPVSNVPATPPSVLSDRTAPVSCPAAFDVAPSRSAYGNAAPRSSVGTNTTHPAATTNRAAIAIGS